MFPFTIGQVTRISKLSVMLLHSQLLRCKNYHKLCFADIEYSLRIKLSCLSSKGTIRLVYINVKVVLYTVDNCLFYGLRYLQHHSDVCLLPVRFNEFSAIYVTREVRNFAYQDLTGEAKLCYFTETLSHLLFYSYISPRTENSRESSHDNFAWLRALKLSTRLEKLDFCNLYTRDFFLWANIPFLTF